MRSLYYTVIVSFHIKTIQKVDILQNSVITGIRLSLREFYLIIIKSSFKMKVVLLAFKQQFNSQCKVTKSELAPVLCTKHQGSQKKK